METRPRVVVDASAVVRAVIDRSTDARSWLERVDRGAADAFAPDLIYAEVADSLVRYVRAGRSGADQVVKLLATVAQLPIETRSSRTLFGVAYGMAVVRGVSAYDAHYLALAEAEDAVLVTADGDLAAAASRSILLD